jgi:uncharacterized protein (TIGR01615 family)
MQAVDNARAETLLSAAAAACSPAGCSASSPTAADTPDDSLLPQLFVVDPCFKEQFQLPNATPEYSALFQELPDLFVGTAEQLVPVVELMCTQVRGGHVIMDKECMQ